MTTYDYDLFVIGAGSGGVRASRMAAQMGKKVAVAEDAYLGGTCVNVGCVPKKLFVYGSHFSEDFHASEGFGWKVGDVSFDWNVLRENKNKEISRLNGIYKNILQSAGVELIDGRAKFESANSVSVNGKVYTAERILIATGGKPFVPEFAGSDLTITSNEAFYLESLPKKIIVVGGGYIAVEFAGIFNGLGVETHLVYRGEALLRGFDTDIQEFVTNELKNKGIHVHLNNNIESITGERGNLTAAFTDGSEKTVGEVMYATGRKPHVDNLGLDNTGVTLEKGAIVVDDNFQTNESSIYAIGDVINRIQLTPVALAEGMALVNYLYKKIPITLSYDNIPTAVFSQPNIATVGVTEAQAKERGLEVVVFKSEFRHMKHTLSGVNERTLMKIIVDKESDKVLGCHMVGSDAGEIIQGLAVAITAGATKAHFDQTVGIHPTAAEEFVTMREPVS